MRWLLLVLILCGCSVPTTPVLPEIEVWFQGVPLEQYSRDAEIWFAFQAHATVEPADTIFWRLEYEAIHDWVVVKEGQTMPGLRAGHRWYIPRDMPIHLRFTAWGAFPEAVATLNYPLELPGIL